jgi:hypothetical protein
VDQTGLANFGDAPLDEGLSVFCQSLSEEARLTPEGVEIAEKLLLGSLVQRLKVEDYLSHNPDIVEQDVAPILLMIGMPRNGTTAFSQHLSEDPNARSVLRWELVDLVPPPRDVHTDRDPRLLAGKTQFEAAFKAMPWRQAILPNNYDDPAEHGALMALTFMNLQIPTLYRVPSYQTWLLEQDLTPGYAYFAKMLKLLQTQKPAKHWNLKLPPDLFALEAFEKVFPGTRYVWTHRHPFQSLSSVCSLSANLREKQTKATGIDKHEIGAQQLRFQWEAVSRALAARGRIGEHRFTDVRQADLRADVVATISDLYARLGMEMTDAYRRKLKNRIKEKPSGRFGRHDHQLAEFGLTEAMIEELYAPYISRFHASTED